MGAGRLKSVAHPFEKVPPTQICHVEAEALGFRALEAPSAAVNLLQVNCRPALPLRAAHDQARPMSATLTGTGEPFPEDFEHGFCKRSDPALQPTTPNPQLWAPRISILWRFLAFECKAAGVFMDILCISLLLSNFSIFSSIRLPRSL